MAFCAWLIYGVGMRGVRTIVVLGLAAIAAAVLWRVATRAPPASPAGAGVAGFAAPSWKPLSVQTLNHGRFTNLTVVSPHATPRAVVLLLSGADGWNPGMAEIANGLAQQGAMVVGISVPELEAALETDGAQCVFPDGDLENLSHFLQAYYHLPTYMSPIVAGYGAGGTLAYAMLAQAPPGTFAAAMSLGFCPGYPYKKRLCKGTGLDFSPHPRDDGVDFLPFKQLADPWVVMRTAPRQGAEPAACDAAVTRGFVAQVPQAQWMDGTDYTGAFDALLAHIAPPATAVAPAILKDLPIVEVAPPQAAAPAGSTPSDLFAIMLSGDGGWAGIDKEVAAALAADGIPVIGLDSLRYFWSARTPAGLAADLNAMIQYYLPRLGKRRVMLIGYSQGADVLPFAVNRLPPATRSRVALTAIMGMSEHALFEFHVSSWVADDNSGPATLPEVDRIDGMTVLCIYGEDETDSLCPKLDAHKFTVVKLKGGHHFDGNYAGLAQRILASAGVGH
jgi:type IV secretory pathway VirJ component